MTLVRSSSRRGSRTRLQRFSMRQWLLTGAAFIGMLTIAPPSSAAWDAETAENVTVKAVDAILIRPVSTIRVVVGAALFLPASLFSSPTGRDGIQSAYEILIEAPMEYAFDRKLGDFD